MIGARTPGWEARLAKVLEAARGEPYVLGVHDCFRVACQAVQALTGADLWTAWEGSYRTRPQALRRIAEYGGGDFNAAFSRLFEAVPVPAQRARRGDIVKLVDGSGTPHLGVCNGSHAAVLCDEGLAWVPITQCELCWAIG